MLSAECCVSLGHENQLRRVARDVMDNGGFGYYMGGATDEWTLKELDRDRPSTAFKGCCVLGGIGCRGR